MPKLLGFVVLLSFGMQSFVLSQTDSSSKNRYFFGSVNFMMDWLPEKFSLRQFAAMRVQDVSHIPLYVDVVGIYKPWNERLLIGGVLQFSIDRYSAYGNWFQYETYQPSFSMLYFLDNKIYVNGMFARCDIGPSMLRVASGDAGWEKTYVGAGILLGLGYAYSIKKMPFFISVNYLNKLFCGQFHHYASGGIGLYLKK